MPPKIKTRSGGLGVTELTEDDDPSGLSAESKLIYSLLSSKLEKIMDRLEMKDEKIEKLEIENATLRKNLSKLEDRVDNIESRERCCDVILSGNSVPNEKLGENLKQICIDLLRTNLKHVASTDAIVSAYRLGTSSPMRNHGSRNILVKFGERGLKVDLISACRRVQPDGLYIRENLTPAKSSILYSLRQVKRKSDRIEYCGSQDGRVFVWLKPTDGQGRNNKVYINNTDTFGRFCSDELDLNPDNFMGGASQK